MRKSGVLVVVFQLLIASIGIAQSDNFIQSNYFSNHIPRNLEKAALGTFGNTPINYYTGLPEVSLNIFTLPSREINVPISLNYDASGIKTERCRGKQV